MEEAQSTKVEELRRREETHKCRTGNTGEGDEGWCRQDSSWWQDLWLLNAR